MLRVIFRPGRSDTVSRDMVPTDFDYIAAGHIHRYQVLPHPRKPSLPFVYPGSIQRISFAEMYEEKCFVEGEVLHGRIETRVIPLPVYDMEIVHLDISGMTSVDCKEALISQSWRLNEDMVIRFNLTGGRRATDYPEMDFQKIREIMPPVLECQFAIKTSKGWLMR